MQTITYKDKTIHIVSTAHVSKESVEEVKNTIETIQPDVVCIELDDKRAHSLTSNVKQEIDIKEIIKSKKMGFFLSNLILSNFQKQIADDLEVEVGGEMKQAIFSANEYNIPIRYIDRDVQITMKRIWSQFGLWKKVNLGATLFTSLLSDEEISAEDVEDLKQSDLLLSSIQELDDKYPEISQVILHERNAYMAQKIKDLPWDNIVVVIGAAHAPGMIESFEQDHDIAALEIIPEKKKFKVSSLIFPGIPLLLLVIITFNSPQMGFDQLTKWILTSSILASIGALISGAHIATIVVTFLTTWIGILSPLLAVGFFSALTEAYFRPPLTVEFETLSEDMKSLKGWYRNRVLKIILIFFATSILSSIGTFISSKNIIEALFK